MEPLTLAAALPIAATVLARAVETGCGLIFLTAGIEKLRHRAVLSGVIANYRILPEPLVPLASVLMGPVELMLGLALLLWPAIIPTLVGAVLLTIFAGAMALNLGRGRQHITCGCGRPDMHQHLRWSMVIRNILLAAALLACGLHTPAALDAMGLASALFAGTLGWIAFHLFQSLNSLEAQAASLARRS